MIIRVFVRIYLKLVAMEVMVWKTKEPQRECESDDDATKTGGSGQK